MGIQRHGSLWNRETFDATVGNAVPGSWVLPGTWGTCVYRVFLRFLVVSDVSWGARAVMKTHYLCSANPWVRMVDCVYTQPLNFGTQIIQGNAGANPGSGSVTD